MDDNTLATLLMMRLENLPLDVDIPDAQLFENFSPDLLFEGLPAQQETARYCFYNRILIQQGRNQGKFRRSTAYGRWLESGHHNGPGKAIMDADGVLIARRRDFHLREIDQHGMRFSLYEYSLEANPVGNQLVLGKVMRTRIQ